MAKHGTLPEYLYQHHLEVGDKVNLNFGVDEDEGPHEDLNEREVTTSSFWIRLPSTESGIQICKFRIRSPVWKFLNRLCYKSGIAWTLNENPDIFLSGDVARLSPVLYHEYCIQDGNLVLRFSLLPVEESTLLLAFFFNFWVDSAIILDANSVPFTMHALLPIFPEEFWVLEWIWIHVRYVWTGKFNWKFLNPQRKICGFKNVRIHVDRGLRLAGKLSCQSKKQSHCRRLITLLLGAGGLG